MTKPMTRTLDLLRNRPLEHAKPSSPKAAIRGSSSFYVRIEPIDGPLHVTEKTAAHRTKDEAYRHARTVLGMDEPGKPSTTLADLEADSEDGFKNHTGPAFAALRAALG